MRRPRYFLGIVVAYHKHGLVSLRTYVFDLLEQTALLGCKPASTLMKLNLDI